MAGTSLRAGAHFSRMAQMQNIIRLIKNEEGATAIEYGLIASLIAVVIIGALTALGSSLTTTFTSVSASL